MYPKAAQVINLNTARALRDTLEAIHSPAMQAVIFDGALSEFKKVISPALRDLLVAKGTPMLFQEELIALLEHVYASQHVDQKPKVTP